MSFKLYPKWLALIVQFFLMAFALVWINSAAMSLIFMAQGQRFFNHLGVFVISCVMLRILWSPIRDNLHYMQKE